MCAKFSGTQAKPRVKSPVKTVARTTRTFNGDIAQSRDVKSDLFILGITNMVGEDTFYESAKTRDDRFKSLIRQVAKEDPEWLIGFTPFLRNEMNMRSAPIVVAAEAVAAGMEGGRKLVNVAMSRADEPAELIGYWMANYGRSIPKPIKRGISDAMQRLVNGRSAIKYDGLSRDIRMGDVIDLVHPTPRDDQQSSVFRYLLDRRHNNVKDTYGDAVIDTMLKIEAMPQDKLRAYLIANPDVLNAAGYTWERLSGLGKMDAEAWEAVIPSMGYMALLRNLRNFEQAGVSESVLRDVSDRIADPTEVAMSRQFPFRMLSAYKATQTLTFASALEKALDASTQNIPEFDKETLVLVDTSGSMSGRISAKSSVTLAEIGYLFGAAVIKRSGGTLVQFADYSKVVDTSKGASVLRLLEGVNYGEVGHGTALWPSVAKHLTSKHSRIVVFSDMQANYFGRTKPLRSDIPSYFFNLGGYAPAPTKIGEGNSHEIGGFSDACFKMIRLLERGKNAKWPWEE
jgi:hypothetical protein